MAMYKLISKRRTNKTSSAWSRSFLAVAYFSTAPQKGIEVSNLLTGRTKSSKLSGTPHMSKSSDTSHDPPHYLAVKFAGGKVINCEVKPLVNFDEDDLSRKLERGWCALCDLKPLEKISKGKLIGAVKWDGERFKSIQGENLDSGKFLQQELHQLGEKEEKEQAQLEQQRLEVVESVMKKVSFLEWALLCGLAVIMGVFIRLTWWDWDWDAVEPFSFVFMFSLLIASFAYFVLTKKDMTYEGARRRAINILITREAKRRGFKLKLPKDLSNKAKNSH